jgi:hypothetical protein
MDAAELGYNAWVLIPNMLTTALRSADIPDRETLLRLQETIDPLSPPQILGELAQLSPADRVILRHTYALCLQHLGREAESALGLPPDVATEVMAHLEN